MKKTSLLILSILFLFGFNLNAVEMKQSEEKVVETGSYADDYMFYGQKFDFQGEARDLYSLSEKTLFSGKTALALFALAEEIDITGTVGNGVKAAARAINIGGNVTGTNFMAAESIMIEPESQITGDTFIGARDVTIKGRMIGDLYAGAAEISIENEIQGDVNVHTGQLRIPESGKITGNLIYHSDQEISEEEAARVTGEIKFEKEEEPFLDDHYSEESDDSSFWFPLLLKLSFIIFGLLFLLFPATKFLERQYTQKEILKNSIWGLIPIFIYPTAIVVSIILLITIPLSVVLLLAYMPLVFVTKMLGITVIGTYLANMLNIKANNRFLSFLIGAVLYSVLSLIPYIGLLLLIFVSSIGCGMIVSSLFNKELA